MQGASGMLGNNIVYRQRNGETIVANRPKKRKGLSAKQQLTVDRFRTATIYAKRCMKRTEYKALYARGIDDKKLSAYAVALSDHLNPPTIQEIDVKDYHGRAGEIIRVRATDDFKVVSVKVRITDAGNNLIEEGDAQARGKRGLWRMITTVGNTNATGLTITATARDVAENAVKKVLVL